MRAWRRLSRIADALGRPVDAAGPAAFRILFGLVMFAGIVRFIASGWIAKVYVEPRIFFKYWGFGWVEPLPEWGMVALYVALAVCALGIALGLFYRASAALFFVGFSYAHLIDVTNYLNHYYLVSLLALLAIFLPLHRAWSLDAWRRPALRADTVPAWVLHLLRLQVGVVYVYAGLAKLQPDWLLHAQPLNLWLTARTELPVIGPYLDRLWVAYAASWAGFLYDTTIVAWLSFGRTRPFAYAVLLVFHALTHIWFDIGMFPFIMSTAALVFFPPSWPRRLLRRVLPRAAASAPAASASPSASAPAPARPRPALVAALMAYAAFQVLFPLRHLLYPGDVLWNEEGMRFSWKVMVREKHGSVTFHVSFPSTGKRVQISPRQYLTAKQEREMAGQPDLIIQLAHRIAADFRARGHADVEVRAEAWVSLNGRPPRLLIDPDRDLVKESDGMHVKRWILGEPPEAPRQLRATLWR